MEIAGGGSNICVVPPGFRFHPTDEELLYYYLKKKVSYESIDLDVIREVDLNKLEPWDLNEKCRIGSGPQNEWYFFSHKDKKYPTGTRTNRATTAGFWKATGRDKAIHLTSNSKRIGMRKTLVFYTGRAPHGQKTDWIMHEYRLMEDDQFTDNPDVQEDGWVVCRVFKKKIHSNRTFEPHEVHAYNHHPGEEDHQVQQHNNMITADDNQIMTTKMMKASAGSMLDEKQNLVATLSYDCCTFDGSNTSTNSSMQHHHRHHQYYLPQLLSSGGGSPDHNNHSVSGRSTFAPSHIYHPPLDPFPSPNYYQALIDNSTTTTDIIECSQNLLRLTSASLSSDGTALLQHQQQQQQQERFATDWSFLDKLLASSSHGHHQHLSQPHKLNQLHPSSSAAAHHDHNHALELSIHPRFPFHYLGLDNDILKFPK